MGSTRRSFTAEYREAAVSLVLQNNRSIADVAQSIDVSAQTLGRWVNKQKQSAPDAPATASERAELERLRKENAQLRIEVEFLKIAAAWFARQTQ